MNKKIQFFKKTLPIIIIALVFMGVAYIVNLQTEVAENVLRLHIVAESNSISDQLIKLCVRDRVISEFSEVLKECRSAEDAAELAEEFLPEIERCARQELARFGKREVAAKVEKCRFPTKKYGSMTFPAGDYTALNIRIGDAEGRNWWCVMYPPLCLNDSCASMPEASAEKLKESLTEEGYELITKNTLDVKIKFKIAEIIFGDL